MGRIRRMAAIIFSILCVSAGMPCMTSSSYAGTETVTIKVGDIEYYDNAQTSWKWITHVNGEAIDLSDEPGVSRSYAYCIQPNIISRLNGTHAVTVLDYSESGRNADMRKMVYYLPGAYGYKAVTASRWFSSGTSGVSAYALGHIALSYMYDGCSDSSDAWDGVGDSIKAKVKSMVSDLPNLPDPPDSFEVFWVLSDTQQDVFGAFYATEYGKAAVKKLSSNTRITQGNDCYSLAGAQYTVFTDAACTNVAVTRSGGAAVITVKSDGSSDEVEIETGDYYIKETSAPRGYALDTDVHSIKIQRDKTTTYTAYDIPKNNPVSVLLQKTDRETGIARAQGAASLEGAEYTVAYYDATPDADMSDADMAAAIEGREPAEIDGKSTVWVFRTDAKGVIDMSDPDKYLIKARSAGLYSDSQGRWTLPIGIITISETKAPKGYVLDSKTYFRAVRETGTVETLKTFNTLTGTDAHREQVYRGDICFSKSSEGKERLHNVPFRITSLTTGESHIIVTDENGYASTASCWNLHKQNTNSGLTSTDGIWFNGYNSSNGARPDNTLGALPYDTYRLEELRCNSNNGYELISDTITISRDNVVIDMGTYDDEKQSFPEPKIVSYKEVRRNSPQTGDNTRDIILYSALAFLALTELALLTALRKGGRLKQAKYLANPGKTEKKE